MILLDRRGHAEQRHVDAVTIMRVLGWHREQLGAQHAIAAARELLRGGRTDPTDWAQALVEGRARLEGDTRSGLRLVYGDSSSAS
jgi:hypothetical protein